MQKKGVECGGNVVGWTVIWTVKNSIQTTDAAAILEFLYRPYTEFTVRNKELEVAK